jgi:hypothetical protein
MRTTLTLDEDVAARLEKLARCKRMSFKEVVNATLRRGLAAPELRSPERAPFHVRAFRSPFRPGIDEQRLNQLVDELDVQRLAKAPS